MQELAVLASSVLASQRQFTAVADNVANVNTQGFRKLEMEFRESVSRPNNHATASYVEDRAIRINQSEGSLTSTGNQLDLALGGSGFFAVNVNGTTQYTRRGQFVINSEGVITTPEGYPLLDTAGAQIEIPEGTVNVKIAEDGTVSNEDGQLAQVGVYDFSPTDIKKLKRAGTTAFIPMFGAAAQTVDAPTIKQGFLEGSNVNAVEEMVNLQAVTRAYENSAKLMNGLEDMEDRAIRTLGTAQ